MLHRQDEQLQTRPLSRKKRKKKKNMVGGSDLKFAFDFIETTYEPLHLLDKRSLIQ
jgi:hypothetical protein